MAVALFVAVLLPAPTSAQIVISEFLYDAPGADTDQEFIELFNAGASAVDLTQWKINDGSNHGLNVPPKNGGTGSITIAPGTYLLLVDNATNFIELHSGITVSVIDTVLSLTNTSGTISLIDDGGSSVDSVSYAKEQGGAGDGNSLARSSMSGTTFVASAPTPGTAWVASSPGNSNANTGTGTGQTTSPEGGSSAYVPPETQLFADGGSDRTVIVGADVQFVGRAYNRKKEVVSHARLVWNFGDGSRAEGASVLHRFDYPGRYVVVLDIAESENPSSDQIIITAEQAQMAFLVMPDGSVSIENRSPHTLDLSRWIIQGQAQIFVLPDHSLVLAGTSMRVSPHTLGFMSSVTTELAYPNRVVALRAGESTGTPSSTGLQPVPQANSPPRPVPTAPPTVVSKKRQSPPAYPDDTDLPPGMSAPDAEEAASSTQLAAAASAGSTSYPWWLGAVALAALAGGALFVAQRFGKREWDIVEEE